jgi:malonate-semialdehyde dehydrogenase (acetylating) / methylmalonate-semialdehyde dehydrogenase
MAASVLLTIGEQKGLVDMVVEKAKLLVPAQDGPHAMGPVIDSASVQKITGYIQQAVDGGAKLLLDGRSWLSNGGNYVGPTVILHSNITDPALHAEIFGTLCLHRSSNQHLCLQIGCSCSRD